MEYTAVLNSQDLDFLEKQVSEFEQRNGEVLGDGETPDTYNCGGNCFGCCTEVVRASGVTGRKRD